MVWGCFWQRKTHSAAWPRFQVLNAFSSAGIDLESVEAVPVDPNSSKRHEQQIMYAKEPPATEDENTWEEGTPLSPDEVKQRFQGRMK
eukprot:g7918.t1